MPWDSRVRKKLAEGEAIASEREEEVCKRHSRCWREPILKSRTLLREGSKREESSIAKELRYCIRRALGEHCGRRDETAVGAGREDASVDVRLELLPCINSICRTAVYVTRSYGGVGGRGREASSYPE